MSLKDMVPFGKRSSSPETQEQNPFAVLRREIDSIFDNFFRGIDAGALESKTSGFVPRIDVNENEHEITVSAELPGMDEKDIDVSVSREALTIQGEKKEEREEKGTGYYRTERSFGSFSRSVPLPVEIDQDKVSAAFMKGVLTVTLPKKQGGTGKTNKIKVNVS